jgi:hypothetical protein
MKLVKLTNSAADRKGDPVYINPSQIISVYEDPIDGGSLATKVFGGGLTWTVEEGLTETVDLIKKAFNDE